MHKSTKQTESVNDVRLGRKCLWIWIVLQALVLIVWVFYKDLIFIAQYMKGFVPSIAKLNEKGVQEMAAVYFSISILLSPFLLIYVAWKENALNRVQETGRRNNRSIGKTILTIFLAVPFFFGVFALVYFAPFEMSNSPRLSGQFALHFMINTELGLVLLAPLFVFALVLNLSLIYFLFSIPFIFFIKLIKG